MIDLFYKLYYLYDIILGSIIFVGPVIIFYLLIVLDKKDKKIIFLDKKNRKNVNIKYIIKYIILTIIMYLCLLAICSLGWTEEGHNRKTNIKILYLIIPLIIMLLAGKINYNKKIKNYIMTILLILNNFLVIYAGQYILEYHNYANVMDYTFSLLYEVIPWILFYIIYSYYISKYMINKGEIIENESIIVLILLLLFSIFFIIFKINTFVPYYIDAM